MKLYGGYSLISLREQFERGETLPGWSMRALLNAAEELERKDEPVQVTSVFDTTQTLEAGMRDTTGRIADGNTQ